MWMCAGTLRRRQVDRDRADGLRALPVRPLLSRALISSSRRCRRPGALSGDACALQLKSTAQVGRQRFRVSASEPTLECCAIPEWDNWTSGVDYARLSGSQPVLGSKSTPAAAIALPTTYWGWSPSLST